MIVLLALGALMVPPQAEGGSIEALLRRARAERAERHAALRGEVLELVTALEGHAGTGSPVELEGLRRELDELGPEAALVLLPYIDPGPDAPDAVVFRSREVTQGLVRMEARGLIDELAPRSRTGPPLARLHAIRVLGACPETERAARILIDLGEGAAGETRLEIVAALARLGGPMAAGALRQALTDDDAKVVATALEALADSRATEAAPAVLNLTRVTNRAHRVVGGIAAYYRACPEVVEKDEVAALTRLALLSDVEVVDRVAVLEALPDFEASSGTEVRRQIAPLFEAANTSLREAALVCASLLGERSARKALLRDYDEVVEANSRWPEAFMRRGDVYVRIAEYTDAIKDYREALDLLRERAKQRAYQELWIKMARAYLRSGKLRQAHDTLRDSEMGSEELRALASDPEFAPLVETPRYSDLFE